MADDIQVEQVAHVEGRELPDEDVVVAPIPRRSVTARLVSVIAMRDSSSAASANVSASA